MRRTSRGVRRARTARAIRTRGAGDSAAEAWLAANADATGWWVGLIDQQRVALARAYESVGRPRDAIALYRKALASLLTRWEVKPVTVERSLARTRARLATLLARSNPTEAAELARPALAWYQAAGGYDADVAAMAKLAGTPSPQAPTPSP